MGKKPSPAPHPYPGRKAEGSLILGSCGFKPPTLWHYYGNRHRHSSSPRPPHSDQEDTMV